VILTNIGGARPDRVHPRRLGRRAEVVAALESEAAVVANGSQEFRSTGGGRKTQHGHLLNANGQRGDGDVALSGVPLGQIVAAIEGQAGSVQPMVAIKGVDLEGLNHPAQLLGVLGNEAGADPGGVVGLQLSVTAIRA
jgi:hypothetical protein